MWIWDRLYNDGTHRATHNNNYIRKQTCKPVNRYQSVTIPIGKFQKRLLAWLTINFNMYFVRLCKTIVIQNKGLIFESTIHKSLSPFVYFLVCFRFSYSSSASSRKQQDIFLKSFCKLFFQVLFKKRMFVSHDWIWVNGSSDTVSALALFRHQKLTFGGSHNWTWSPAIQFSVRRHLYQCVAMKRHCWSLYSGESVDQQDETDALGFLQPFLGTNAARIITHNLYASIHTLFGKWYLPSKLHLSPAHIMCDIRLTILVYFLPVNFHDRKYIKRYGLLLTFLAIQPFWWKQHGSMPAMMNIRTQWM